VFSSRYPLVEDFSVYARWANAHGRYDVEVQLRTFEGEVVRRHRLETPIETHDPLQSWQLPLHHLPFTIPAAGKYEVALLATGQVVASDTLIAHLNRPGR
jgi:hypothetical protein